MIKINWRQLLIFPSLETSREKENLDLGLDRPMQYFTFLLLFSRIKKNFFLNWYGLWEKLPKKNISCEN